MESQAKVFLRALNGDINISERAIVLSPENTIQIGRASKSPNKNLTAAADNAWFDSPVMSREHAELQFHPQNSTVTIRDIGSMHGTFVNSTRLSPHVTNNLSNGDTLVLGIEVKRGSEIFPACSFIFNCELIPYTSTIPSTSYVCPESSDLEEEEEYDTSDDDLQAKDTPSSNDAISPDQFRISTSSQLHDHIDLTRDDSPERGFVECAKTTSSNIITTASAHNTVELMASQPVVGHFHVPCSSSNPSQPIIVESDDDEDNGFSTESEETRSISEDSLDESDDAGSCVDYGEESDSDIIEIGDGSDDDGPIDASSGPFSVHYKSGFSEDEDGDFNSDAGFEANLEEAVHQGHIAAAEVDTGFTPGFDTRHQISRDTNELDNDSDVSLSEVGREGIQILLDDNLLDKDDDHASGRGQDSTAYVIPDTYIVSSNLQTVETSAEPNQTSCPPGLFNRQPSPSDAAMVKPAAPPMEAFKADISSKSKLTAQYLGEKTGKHEFFEARHHNQARFNSDRLPGNEASNAPASISNQVQNPRIIATPKGSWARKFQASRNSTGLNVNDCLSSFPPLSYLDNHAMAPPVINTYPSPEPDLTSAVAYNQSKAALMNKIPTTSSNRSNISIRDIIDKETIDQPATNLKRKAEEIDAVPVCAENTASINNGNWTSNAKKSSESSDLPVTTVSRPTKKLKRFVERLGYAALGGVAVGGALFSVLVATAPDFV